MGSSKSEEETSGSSSPLSRTRLRASHACTVCRIRKVRCDVVVTGFPCTNCRLDSANCKVMPRKRKWEQRVKRVLEQEEKERRDRSRQLVEERARASIHISSTAKAHTEVKPDPTRLASSISPPMTGAASTIPVYDQDNADAHFNAPKLNFVFSDGTIDPSKIEGHPSHDGCSNLNSWAPEFDNLFVPYSSYNFIDAGFLNQLSHADVSYLTEKGCLTLPPEKVLEEFFHQYFSHIHPIIPLLSEAEFWAVDARIPLLLVRAILFIASPTLMQFDIHRNNVVNAQVAVMLTYHSPTTSDTTNTYWMVNAVHYARCARADQYHTLSDDNPRKLHLKRLWWACILRDRILSLSLRRPLNIGCDEFDFSLPGLSLADFSDEIEVSTVYDRPTKQILAHMMAAFCELIIPLNKALTMLHPAAGPKTVTSETDIQKETDACVETLQLLDVWYQKTRERFEISTPSIGVHKSLTMFTKMTFIYYYSARASLCYHMMLLSVSNPRHASDQKNDLQLQAEMDSALKGITGIFMHLARLGLVQYLPNTFVALSAIPLIWQVLDAKILNTGTLAADNKRDLMVYTNVMNKFRSLHENADNVLKFIKQIIAHIQTTESVDITQPDPLSAAPPPAAAPSETYFPPELLSNFAQGGNKTRQQQQETDSSNKTIGGGVDSSSTTTGGGPQSKWAKLFAGKPRTYLRIALTIQHSLSSGHFPSEEDFPKALQMVKFAEETMDNGIDVGLYKYLQHMEDFLLSA
ncbi:N-terminal binuclear Zn cluster-containing protein [Trichoderma citrinoviride]|uniref:N-terminal binuclear Zn cluster-containing protein n=1 Tax=Trichoderma citrinoviride TaxID=58853 RepID=A0A2T4BBX8_9HYPO|nr:N-terminal binuclear Zn cluster-containing protein [Trichoderma citrinoviride]PTB66842.1 N-terminal binuclear Zn cluster-containing protein [Trichoderma citrinoviride]